MGIDLRERTMKDTASSNAATPMTLKKLDDQASKDFWDYVQKSKQDWREQQPAWSRELERDEKVEVTADPTDASKPLACKS